MGAVMVATCGGAGGQRSMAVRPPASTHRPRGTGLSPSRASLAVGVQLRLRGPRTARSSGASACARAGYSVADVAGARRDVARGFAHFKNYSA
jgi:hypothetical protein